MTVGSAMLVAAIAHAQAPCPRAAATDTQPWIHNLRVLESFELAQPAPVFVGDFEDANATYRLHLVRDQIGFFGALSYPVLESDSPTAVLRNVSWDPQTGVLEFVAAPSGQDVRMKGVLSQSEFHVSEVGGRATVELELVKLREGSSLAWRSRDQFECAMRLGRRN
ncbi:hypothetical protein [Ramlibacter algicola]|uniref:Uncharacterized protein n=1 Tax=Ramlibacter algicola TaxID=2795217 RepID=A0A934PYA3_9BURK|nr:hypothetical protein [Ramlibacter algicola]MBK0392704.1 hypothetical protein [Ramlibacter algicola]